MDGLVEISISIRRPYSSIKTYRSLNRETTVAFFHDNTAKNGDILAGRHDDKS